jgi:hypothetical protein
LILLDNQILFRQRFDVIQHCEMVKIPSDLMETKNTNKASDGSTIGAAQVQ